MKKEYSENTIIQSMNDMKEQYEKIKSTSISLYSYNLLQTKFSEAMSILSTNNTLINCILKKLQNHSLYNYIDDDIDKIKSILIILKDLNLQEI